MACGGVKLVRSACVRRAFGVCSSRVRAARVAGSGVRVDDRPRGACASAFIRARRGPLRRRRVRRPAATLAEADDMTQAAASRARRRRSLRCRPFRCGSALQCAAQSAALRAEIGIVSCVAVAPDADNRRRRARAGGARCARRVEPLTHAWSVVNRAPRRVGA
ncbi:hypothetical protein AQ809_07365 [Burkholderia pseudomallei]|nr:hypothetical protein AQ809_07365 [Burkholderia pseudomallei]